MLQMGGRRQIEKEFCQSGDKITHVFGDLITNWANHNTNPVSETALSSMKRKREQELSERLLAVKMAELTYQRLNRSGEDFATLP